MTEKNPSRSNMVEELAISAFEIGRLNLRERGTELSPTTAIATSFLRLGRRSVLESLKGIDDDGQIQPIGYYLGQMQGNNRAEFVMGLGLGILACTVMSITDGQDYLDHFNQFRTGTPILSEPSESYNNIEARMKGVYGSGAFDPTADRLMIGELMAKGKEDEVVLNILEDLDKLPAQTRLHLYSLPIDMVEVFDASVDLYRDAHRMLLNRHAQLGQTLHTTDVSWLDSIVEMTKDL